MSIRVVLGECMEVAINEHGRVDGETLRIRVKMDVTKPLGRRVNLWLDGEEEVRWFFLQYEQLPNFCYGCSLLGHVMDDCEIVW